MRGYNIIFIPVGIASFLVTPVTSQFGVAGKRKKQSGTTFEEINEMAKQQSEGFGGLPGMDGLGDLTDILKMDPDSLKNMLEGAMNDPEMKKMMEELGGGDMDKMQSQMAETMKLLSDPEALAKEVKTAMETLSSEDTMDALLASKDELLEQMASTGLLSDEILDEYKKNPEKIASDLKNAMGQMKDIFSDPEALASFQEALQNPAKLFEKLGLSEGDMQKFFEDDEKIEEARMQILNSLDSTQNPALASMFGSEESMKEVLNDPVKWRDNVKKGQGMAFGGQAGVGAEL